MHWMLTPGEALAALCFVVATSARSNGVLLGGFLAVRAAERLLAQDRALALRRYTGHACSRWALWCSSRASVLLACALPLAVPALLQWHAAHHLCPHSGALHGGSVLRSIGPAFEWMDRNVPAYLPLPSPLAQLPPARLLASSDGAAHEGRGPEWCEHASGLLPPPVYASVQARFWGVGPFAYWRPD